MLGAPWRTRPLSRWRHRLPALIITAALPLAAFVMHLSAGAAVPIALAGRSPQADETCPSLDPATAGQAATRQPATAARLTLADNLDKSGELAGRRLSLDGASGRLAHIDLPAESSVADPLGSAVVYTVAPVDASSEVYVLDADSGCDSRLAQSSEVIRSAIISGAGDAIYLHSVSRAQRNDLGVTRIDLASGEATLVVPPLPPSADFGPTFGTELRWNTERNALLVQSCGFSSCRSRVLDPASGRIASYDHAGQGELIGLTASHLLTYAACGGLPCDVLSTELSTGTVSTLSTSAFAASLIGDTTGRYVLRIETVDGITEVEQ